MGSLVAGQEFQHILRLLNTNVDGKHKVMFAMTAIRGIGRRFSNVVCKKAEVDMKKRAGGWMVEGRGGEVGVPVCVLLWAAVCAALRMHAPTHAGQV